MLKLKPRKKLNAYVNVLRLLALLLLLTSIGCKKDTPEEIVPELVQDSNVPYGTPFANAPLTEDIVMYEVNVRCFSAEGTINGVTERLDEIKKLGVNVVWIMPIYTVGKLKSNNSPYCIKDYKTVGSEYGTLADLRTLTDEAHKRNMTVILDWVANHTSWDNAWIANKSWYTQNTAGEIISPLNMGWPDVADLNFTNAEMKLAMIDAMKYWVLQANVDGFRCDYANGVPYSFWKQAIDTLRAMPGRKLMMLAEGDRADHYKAGFDLTFSWSFYSTIKNVFQGASALNIYKTHISELSSVPAGKYKLRFTTNHDESAWDNTPTILFNGEEGALAASAITIFSGGVPLLYSSQEIGWTSKVPFFSKSPWNWNVGASILEAYQDMMTVYTSSDAARKGTLTDFSDTTTVCFRKIYNQEQLFLIANTRERNLSFTLPAELQNTTCTDAITDLPVTLSTELPLGMYQYILLKK